MPEYSFDEFKRCCIENPMDIIPRREAGDLAAAIFGLRTKSELLNFIGNDGLENLTFINTKPWEKNPDPSSTILIDAYEFRSGSKLGYISFMRNQKTKKWIIKSFHLSKNSNLAIAFALRKARLIGEDLT